MKVFYKKYKRNNIQRTEKSIFENNNDKNKDLNMLL